MMRMYGTLRSARHSLDKGGSYYKNWILYLRLFLVGSDGQHPLFPARTYTEVADRVDKLVKRACIFCFVDHALSATRLLATSGH